MSDFPVPPRDRRRLLDVRYSALTEARNAVMSCASVDQARKQVEGLRGDVAREIRILDEVIAEEDAHA